MDIGKEERTIQVPDPMRVPQPEPVRQPRREPAPKREPVKNPERPVKVPER